MSAHSAAAIPRFCKLSKKFDFVGAASAAKCFIQRQASIINLFATGHRDNKTLSFSVFSVVNGFFIAGMARSHAFGTVFAQ